MYRGKYESREQAQAMRRENERLYRRHRDAIEFPYGSPAKFPETKSVFPVNPRDVKRSVYLPAAGSIAFSLLYQVAR